MAYINFTNNTIEPADSDNGYWLIRHGTYGESSVRAGEYCRQKSHWYSTLDEAMNDNPGVEVLDHTTGIPKGWESPMPDVPPAWFDPSYAGEVWHENDC